MFAQTRVLTKKIVLGFFLSMVLLPMMAFASSEFKGTETVNVNKANAATLAAYLKGIGPNKAEAIVKYRRANGNFKNITDLKNVPGIGDETYKDMKRHVSTSRGKSTAPKGYKLGESSGKSTSSKKKKTTKKSKSTSSSASSSDSSSSKSVSSKAKKSKKKSVTSSSSSTAKKKKEKATKDSKKKTTKATKKKKPTKTKKKTTKKKKKKS